MCPLCGSERSASFPLHYYLKDRRFDARRCRTCRFIYVYPRPSDADLALMYSNEYFLHDGADFGAHSATDYETAAKLGAVKFPVILGQIKRFKTEGKFFEIGCGMGYFLDYVRGNGFDVAGIEFAELGAEMCRSKFGLDVTRSSFEEYQPRETYDVVFMGDVLEHLVDPLAMLRKARSMTAPGGVVAAELPSQFNCFSGKLGAALLSLLGKSKRMPMPPYHVNEFVPRTITTMMLNAGFSRVFVFQRIKPPSSITLRGSIAEKVFKLSLQYPNYIVTTLTGKFGDRLLAVGIR